MNQHALPSPGLPASAPADVMALIAGLLVELASALAETWLWGPVGRGVSALLKRMAQRLLDLPVGAFVPMAVVDRADVGMGAARDTVAPVEPRSCRAAGPRRPAGRIVVARPDDGEIGRDSANDRVVFCLVWAGVVPVALRRLGRRLGLLTADRRLVFSKCVLACTFLHAVFVTIS